MEDKRHINIFLEEKKSFFDYKFGKSIEGVEVGWKSPFFKWLSKIFCLGKTFFLLENLAMQCWIWLEFEHNVKVLIMQVTLLKGTGIKPNGWTAFYGIKQVNQ